MAGRHTYREKAVVLDHTKLAEQDLILTMLAEDGRQLRAVGKGARKPGGRLAGRVELFCETDFLMAHGRTLDVVAEASLVDAHAGLRGDLSRVSAASAMCEVAKLTSFEDAPDGFLFPLLSRALRAAEEATDQAHLDVAVAAYVMKVLAHAGWRPELGLCVACGDPAPTWFSAAAGGVLCSSCVREIAGAEQVSATDLAWMRALIGSTFDDLLAARVDAGEAALLLGLSHQWAATHLESRLRAMEFMLSV